VPTTIVGIDDIQASYKWTEDHREEPMVQMLSFIRNLQKCCNAVPVLMGEVQIRDLIKVLVLGHLCALVSMACKNLETIFFDSSSELVWK
jgi:hypothetical protein